MVVTIGLYEAVNQMRKLTTQGKTFHFSHATYNRDSHTTDGIRDVLEAKLRPAAAKDDIDNADFKLFYYDEMIGKPRVCWQMLIMTFNGMKVELN
jgi:hypothetical protein